MNTFKKILAAVSTAAGGYLIYSGFSGQKIPYLEESSEAADIKKRILNNEIRLDFAPVIHDKAANRYAVWHRKASFPGRTQGPFRPGLGGLLLRVTYPAFDDEWEDAREIRVEVTNESDHKSEMAYVSVIAVGFGKVPSQEKDTGIFWYYSRPIQPILPIEPKKTMPMVLKDVNGEMGNVLEEAIGTDFENIGLIVTLYSDWAGTEVYDSVNVLTRGNSFMKQAIADDDVPGEAMWFVKT